MISPQNFSAGGPCSGHCSEEQGPVGHASKEHHPQGCFRVLHISDSTLARFGEWATAQSPAEGVALLLGYLGQADPWRPFVVVEAIAVRNTHSSPNVAFRVDPLDQLKVRNEAQRLGLEVIGVWHSHPRLVETGVGAHPSRRDLREAWENWVYLISGATMAQGGRARNHDSWNHKAWIKSDGRFEPVEIRTAKP